MIGLLWSILGEVVAWLSCYVLLLKKKKKYFSYKRDFSLFLR